MRAYVGYTEQGVIYKECGCLCELLNRDVQGRLRAGTSGYGEVRVEESNLGSPIVTPHKEKIVPNFRVVYNSISSIALRNISGTSTDSSPLLHAFAALLS